MAQVTFHKEISGKVCDTCKSTFKILGELTQAGKSLYRGRCTTQLLEKYVVIILNNICPLLDSKLLTLNKPSNF